MTARLSPEREAEVEASFSAYANHPMIGFDCCSAHPVADAVPELLAELAAVRPELAELTAAESEQVTEWGVRRADGGSPSARHSRQDAVDDIRGLAASDEAAVLVSRTVHYGAWTEAKS